MMMMMMIMVMKKKKKKKWKAGKERDFLSPTFLFVLLLLSPPPLLGFAVTSRAEVLDRVKGARAAHPPWARVFVV